MAEYYILPEDHWVTVKDAAGNDLPPVPSHWTQDDLPAGAKMGKKVRKGSLVAPPEEPEEDEDSVPAGSAVEPAGNASREAWEAFARAQGASEDDLKAADGSPLGRDELRAKYAANL